LTFWWHIRSVVKWVLRRTTKLCELQRICYGKPVGYLRSQAVEYSLSHSKSTEIKDLILKYDDLAKKRELTGEAHRLFLREAFYVVINAKDINPILHHPFLATFGRCIEHIWGYRQLLHQVEHLRLTPFDSQNEEHETKLISLWNSLMPDTPLSDRITKQWQDIGFQGDDPKTDFRGMGLLGLENLLFFSTEYKAAARHVLSHSLHPQFGYAFAIVGINLTSMTYNLLKDGTAKTHLYNICKRMPDLRAFHLMYCYLFYEFDRFWIASKPQDMMQFSFIKEKFESNVRSLLGNPETVFRINFVVDTV